MNESTKKALQHLIGRPELDAGSAFEHGRAVLNEDSVHVRDNSLLGCCQGLQMVLP